MYLAYYLMQHGWYVILNPVSGGGRASKIWAELQRLQVPCAGYAETTGPRHAEQLVHKALAAGQTRLLVLGGDGTIGETCHALLSHSDYSPDRCKVAFVPCGTGNDWARTMRLPQSPAVIAQMLAEEKTLLADIGECEFQTHAGPQSRYFANVAGLGFDAYVAERFLQGNKQGIVRYMLALLRGLGTYRNIGAHIEVRSPHKPPVQMRGGAFLIAGGIGQYFGGGMRVCPTAHPADGELAVTAVLDISRPGVMGQLPRLYSGTFVSHPSVWQATGTELHISATGDQPLWMQADGELMGFTPVTMRVKPAAIQVVIP